MLPKCQEIALKLERESHVFLSLGLTKREKMKRKRDGEHHRREALEDEERGERERVTDLLGKGISLATTKGEKEKNFGGVSYEIGRAHV